jgi:hypothetical protein
MDREEFIERQTWAADRKLALTSDEEDARERFHQLAIDTYDFLISAGADFVMAFDPWPESAGNALRDPGWGKRGENRRIELSPSLIKHWKEWNRQYVEVRARNPQLELRDLMQDISESNDASSWPAGYEARIQDWVDAGDPSAPPPFDDRHAIVKPEFFHRLRELRQLCGGWLYWSNDLGRVVFAPEPEWQRAKAEQERQEAEFKRKWDESCARGERIVRRTSEVLTGAREDAVFWAALKQWELAREAKRPPDPRRPDSRSSASRPLQIAVARQVSPEERAKSENPPVDPIFAEFVARGRTRDDVLTVRDLVVLLRGEMRRELGLDGTLAWPGGPGFGVS